MAAMNRFNQISEETQKARNTSQTHENASQSVSNSKFDKIYADVQKSRTEPSSPRKTEMGKNDTNQSDALSKFERISNAQRSAGREEPKKQEEERTEAVHRRRGIHR